MSPLPRKMENRWANRAQPPPGHGIVSWHLLMRRYPQVCDAATEAQRALSSFPGLHMTPRQWLHITTLMAGPTEAITREQMSAMASAARARLREVPPIPVFIEKVIYHAEAISLGVQPAQALVPILEAVRSATRTVIGPAVASDRNPSTWIPHVTVAYSTTEQPAGPMISALGTGVPRREAMVDAVTLVVQWGPERRWDWEPVGTAYCAATPG
ncbi:2'-5' RNA ligase family protein [Nocardia sp. NPDC002869]|uniref:2'-5' RNA ligase family protein n=1 Tax=Nocardia sp. NPDC002869 TaxID=3161032 RepID=UPI00398CF964